MALDIAIGLIVTFLLFSIVVSGANEWLAQMSARRGYFLRLGLMRLINDEAVYRRVLHHPLIGSLYRERATKGKPPSYVDPNNFAMAICDVLIARAGITTSNATSPKLSMPALRTALASPAIVASPVALAFSPIFDRAGDDVNAALKGIEGWFTASMERVGGWYKARTQKILFAIGLVLAAFANVDAIEIASALNKSPALRESFLDLARATVASGNVGEVDIAKLGEHPLTPAESESLRNTIESLRANNGARFPIGYVCLGVAINAVDVSPSAPNTAGTTAISRKADSPFTACTNEIGQSWRNGSATAGVLKLIGWTLTAFAGPLGAGYWFALLSKAINIRGSGAKPSGNGAK